MSDRGSYMDAQILLNLLTSWRKERQCEASPFRYEFNKFNNTRARMLDIGSYISTHVLFILLNELGKKIQ